jgi:bla regulator protein blaR1
MESLQTELIRAIALTLFHSLWIGLIAAVLAALIIKSTPKSSAVLRYRLLNGVLLLFIVTMVLFFFLEWNEAGAPNPLNAVAVNDEVNTQGSMVQAVVANGSTLQQDLGHWLETNALLIVTGWFICFLFQLARMVIGLVAVHRLRHIRVHSVKTYWNDTLNELCRQCGITRNVQLLQSARITSPVTIGWLRPVILIPLGMLLQLTPAQTEAVLLHELTHIKRRDYIANLLQTFVLTIFFFNPAVNWLIAQLREERENACDDAVMNRIPDKAAYWDALLFFEQQQIPPAMAMGLLSRRSPLINRLQRIVTGRNRMIGRIELIVLSVGLMLLSAFTVFSRQPIQPPRAAVQVLLDDKERVRNFLKDLVIEKVVNDSAAVNWFGISDVELIVNGTKQPAALHQRLREKYGIKPRYGLYYGPVQMYGMGVFIEKDEL